MTRDEIFKDLINSVSMTRIVIAANMIMSGKSNERHSHTGPEILEFLQSLNAEQLVELRDIAEGLEIRDMRQN